MVILEGEGYDTAMRALSDTTVSLPAVQIASPITSTEQGSVRDHSDGTRR